MSKEKTCQNYKISTDKDQINARFNYDAMLKYGEGIEMNKEEASRYNKIAKCLSQK